MSTRERTHSSDEFAPVKAAKQLRKGKRISEIEMLYGSQVTSAAVASTDTSNHRREDSKTKQLIPDLAPEFFASAFFRRFTVQRESYFGSYR